MIQSGLYSVSGRFEGGTEWVVQSGREVSPHF